MKSNPSQVGRTHQAVRLAVLGTGLAALIPATTLAEGDNWIEFSAAGASVDGNDAAYQRRHQNNGDFWGGISDFHFEQIGDNGIFTLDGHAMPGLDDYEIDLSYTLDDIGYIRGGFRQWTTWYDGSGGWYPGAVAGPGWLDPITQFDDELELDRGSIWFEAGLRMPDVPEITFSYEHLWRDGNKDSTFWERGNNAMALGFGVRPGLYRIDEVSDIFALDIRHFIGNTELGGGLRYQSTRNDDTHYTTYHSGGPQTLTQQDINEFDMWSGHLYSTTRFDERNMLSFGYNITSLNSDIGGFRTVSHAYVDLMGGGQSLSQVLNGSYWWNPVDDLVIVPSFRIECWDQDMWGFHGSFPRGGGPLEDILDQSHYETKEYTAACEVRYSGIENMLLYGTAEYSALNGDLYRMTTVDGIIDGTRMTDSDLDRQKYVVGANWYPATGVTLAAQYYYREYDQGYSHIVTGGEDAQLVDHISRTNDANLRLTWRALPNLTFVTRYDYQQTQIDNQAIAGGAGLTAPVQSAEITKHILTESVSWNPTQALYLQLGVHWISSETDTPSDVYAPGVVPDWDNDYWSLSFNGGYAFSPDTQLHWGYYYYHSDNYPASTMPYGNISDEHMLTIGLNQRIDDNALWTLQYGYFKGDDDAAGGFNDYEAHVVSTGIRLSF